MRSVAIILIALLLWTSMAGAVTYYVEPNCGNINTYNPATRACTGGSATSRPTAADGLSLLSSGDTLYLRGGTPANPQVYGGLGNSVPSGLGTTNMTVVSAMPISRSCGGYTMSYPAIEACYESTYETVHIATGVPGGQGIRLSGTPGPPKADKKFIWYEGLIVDQRGRGDGVVLSTGGAISTNPPACDSNSSSPETAPDHIVFMNGAIKNAGNQGLLMGDFQEDIWILNSEIDNNGSDINTDHGLYVKGKNLIIARNRISRNRGYGIHNYDVNGPPPNPQTLICNPRSFNTNARIEKNRIFNNGRGLLVSRNTEHATIRNNLVYGNTQQGIHIGTNGHEVYNNTSVNNGANGIVIGAAGSSPTSALNTIIINNIHDGFNVHPDAQGPGIPEIMENNYNWCSTCASPNFVDAASNDFRLRAGDPRINAGQNLTAKGVTTDFNGCPRPQGGAFDIGAHEFGGAACGGVEPPPPEFDYEIAHDSPEGGESVVQGAAVTVEITITGLQGTAGAVHFSAEGLPSDTTASFSPTSCTPSPTCTSTLTLDTAPTTPEGSYTVTYKATHGQGVGALVRSIADTLVVTCN
jgi:Right handed beta helix region